MKTDSVLRSTKIKKIKSPQKRGQAVFLIVMLFVPIVHWFVFWLYVNFNSILLAFQTKIGEWTLNNFEYFFNEITAVGSNISVGLKNTLLYFCNNIFVIMVLALVISYFMFRRLAGTSAFRIIFYLPGIISSVAMTAVFENFIAPTGPLGAIYEFFGGKAPELLARSRYGDQYYSFLLRMDGFRNKYASFYGGDEPNSRFHSRIDKTRRLRHGKRNYFNYSSADMADDINSSCSECDGHLFRIRPYFAFYKRRL